MRVGGGFMSLIGDGMGLWCHVYYEKRSLLVYWKSLMFVRNVDFVVSARHIYMRYMSMLLLRIIG